MKDLSEVKVGDEVYAKRQYGFSGVIYEREKVTGITPKGRIKIGSRIFNLDGYERIKGSYGGYILPINEETKKWHDEALKEIRLDNMRRNLKQFDYNKLPLDVLDNVYDTVKPYMAK